MPIDNEEINVNESDLSDESSPEVRDSTESVETEKIMKEIEQVMARELNQVWEYVSERLATMSKKMASSEDGLIVPHHREKKSLLITLITFLATEDLSFTRLEAGNVIEIPFSVQDEQLTCYANVREDNEQLIF